MKELLKKQSLYIFLISVLFSFILAENAYSQNKDFNIAFKTDFYSKYLGRGELPTDGPVFSHLLI